MNNKGQTLVLFIALLPFIFILFVFVFDLANLATKKTVLDGIAKDSLRYMIVDEKSESEIKENILKNDSDILIKSIDDSSICLKKEVKPIFGEILGYDVFNIKSCFEGKFENNKLVIIEKGK